jgi:hypothetical protein
MRRWLFLVASCLTVAAAGCGGGSGGGTPDAASADSKSADAKTSTPDATPSPDAAPDAKPVPDAQPDAAPVPDARPQPDAGPGSPDAKTCTDDAICAGKTGAVCADATTPGTCAMGSDGCLHDTKGTACPGTQTCQGAGVCTCPTDAVCGVATAGAAFTTCVGNGLVTCTPDVNTCVTHSDAVSCGDLVCQGAAPAAKCDCPPAGADSLGAGCGAQNSQVCSLPISGTGTVQDGHTDVLICSQVTLNGPASTTKMCLTWAIFGGVHGEGDCAEAEVDCDPTNHICACPAHGGSTWFADPVKSRQLLNSKGIDTTGVQFPEVCAFENFARTLHRAVDQVNGSTGSSNRSYVVLAGGSKLAPAIFDHEPAGTFPAEIPDRVTVTVDTDTRAPGVVTDPAAVAAFDPRSEVIVVNNGFDSAKSNSIMNDGALGALSLTGGTDKSGGQVHGFTIVGGGCASTDTADCNRNKSALLVTDFGKDAVVVNGPRARVDEMFLEGGGGRVIVASSGFQGNSSGAPSGTAAATTATFSATNSTITIVVDDTSKAIFNEADNNGVVSFALESAANPAFSGVYVTRPSFFGTTAVVSLYTNKALSGTASVEWGAFAQSQLRFGLTVFNSNGTFTDNVAENFAQVEDGIGANIISTHTIDGSGTLASVDGAATIKGIYLYNNYWGMIASAGNTTVNDSAVFATDTAPFLHAPTIEHSWDVGLWAQTGWWDTFTEPLVTADDLQVFHTQDDDDDGYGVFVKAGGQEQNDAAVTLTNSNIHHNVEDGAFINSITPPFPAYSLQATSSHFDNNGDSDELNSPRDLDGDGINILKGNTTIITSTANGNENDGIFQHSPGVPTVPNNSSMFTMLNSHADGNGFDGVHQTSGFSTITGSTADNNTYRGLYANSGPVMVDTSEFNGNAVVCTTNGTTVDHFVDGVYITAQDQNAAYAVLKMTNSKVDNNHGGGLEINTHSQPSVGPVAHRTNSIAGSEFNGNGAGASDKNNCHARGEDYSGVIVTGQGDLVNTGAGNTFNTNADNGVWTMGTNPMTRLGRFDASTATDIDTVAGGPITATGNNKSGVYVGVNSTVVLQAGGEVNTNCAMVPKDYIAAAIKTEGALEVDTTAMNIHDNTCDGIYVNTAKGGRTNQSNMTQLALVLLKHNTIGLEVVSTPTDPENADFAAESGTPVLSKWGVVADRLLVSNNTGKAGVVIGGDGQTDDLSILLENSKVGFNDGDGVYSSSLTNDGSPDSLGAGRSAITLYANRIVQDVGSGLYEQQAFIVDGQIDAGHIVGISANVINHNGFGSKTDTECKVGQTVANTVFAGQAPITQSAFDCTSQADSDACGTHQTDGCIWTGTTSKCQRSYQVNGLTGNTTAANTISGYTYRFDTSVLPGPETSGMLSTGDNTIKFAYVNATNNSWSVGTPLAQKDYWQDAFTFIVTQTTVSANNTCTIFTDTPPT